MLTDCTFLRFLSTLHHPDRSNPTDAKTPRKSWKVDEEMWTMLGLSNWDINGDANV
jgi:hypothetical protein